MNINYSTSNENSYKNTVASKQTAISTNYDSEGLDEKHLNDALDNVWVLPWVKELIFNSSNLQIEKIRELAQNMADQTTVIFLSEGETYNQLLSLIQLTESNNSNLNVVIWEPSLSSKELSKRLNYLKNKTLVFIPVAVKEESLIYRCNYTIIKKYITDSSNNVILHGIYPILSNESILLQEDIAENQYEHLTVPSWIEDGYLGSSDLAILALNLQSLHADEYLEGLQKMVNSPRWDSTLPSLSKYIIDSIIHGDPAQFFAVQSEFNPLINRLNKQIQDIYTKLKLNKNTSEKNYYPSQRIITLFATETSEDIMTPFFQGCHQDGSLNLLAADIISRTNDYKGKTGINWLDIKFKNTFYCNITIDNLSAKNCGELIAYLQLTLGIVKEFVKSN